MPTHNLNHLFNPGSIAVVGASEKPAAIGGIVLRNLIDGGFDGHLYAVNPKYSSVNDRPCVANIESLPATPDLVVVCTPASTVPDIIRACGEKGIPGVVVVSAGFREVGKEGKGLEQAVVEQASRFEGLRILGPNCLGFIAPHRKVNASFANKMPLAGHVTFISQSGALGTSILDWAIQERIGFANFVSVGNSLDISIADLIDYFAADPWTESIILYIESIKVARQFMSATRAFARNKPIIAYKAGRFAQSAQAAASHTGAMAGLDAVYDAAFRRAGVIRVFDMEDMFDCAKLLARRRLPKGDRLAVVTNAGGPGVMAADALLARQHKLADLTPETVQALDGCLPSSWSHSNPVDILGDAGPERMEVSLEQVLKDPNVDAILAIVTPQAMTHPREMAVKTAEVARTADKPVLASWIGGASMREAVDVLNSAGVPTFPTPEEAVKAFGHLVSYRRSLDVLYETPRDLPLVFTATSGKFKSLFRTRVDEGIDVLDEVDSKSMLEEYGIPVTRPIPASTSDEAVEVSRGIGYPVALKLLSPQITHKTDVRGVELGLADDAAVRAAFERIVSAARTLRPDAQVDGVTVQKMLSPPVRQELILGARRDPVFGPVLLLGAGGITAELLQDRALELPPLNERLARGMIESLRIAPILHGYRGRPPLQVDRLIDVLIRLSHLVADYPEVQELDINPLLASPEDVVALDARVILDADAVRRAPQRYSHLAIRPYPDDLVQSTSLRDGTSLSLRPIRPEDEPLWHQLLAACSPESLRYRFRGMLKQTTHELAARYCFIDYDREMAIVAEVAGPAGKELIGVGRLVADADRKTAEFAVLVADPWQGRGAGSLLLDACLNIARQWNCRVVTAETSPDNLRMLRLFRERGFALDHHVLGDVVFCRKVMTGP